MPATGTILFGPEQFVNSVPAAGSALTWRRRFGLMARMECHQSKNGQRCNCSYEPCPRKGICCECLAYHLRNRALPGCCFPTDAEASYDRSFEHFARLVTIGKI